MAVQITPCKGEILTGEGRPIVKYRDIQPWAVQKRRTDRGAVWEAQSGGSKEACIRWGSTLSQSDEYDWTVHVRQWCGLWVNLLWLFVVT